MRRFWRHAALLACLALVAVSGRVSSADGYSEDDTLAAISDAPYMVRCIIAKETGYSYDPYAVGREGELGAAQLHPQGLLPLFYQVGYDDPFNPYEAVAFVEWYGARWGYGPWTTARYC